MPRKPSRRRRTGQRPSPQRSRPDTAPVNGFSQRLQEIVPAPSKSTLAQPGAPLVHLDYDDEELRLKTDAIRRFWREHELAGAPEQVTASPRPRGYRTTSKRRTAFRGDKLRLLFGEGVSQGGPAFQPSELEPPEHAALYRFLQDKLSQHAFRSLARHLNYLIIRGTYTERAVVFNVDALNGPLVRKLKLLAEHLQQLAEPPSAALVYHDPSRSDYYLESRRPTDGIQTKKLFGPSRLAVDLAGCRYRFPLTAFSQVNESMVPVMLHLAQELLAPESDDSLLDLYCGYGLFSHFLAPHYQRVVGVDAAGEGIQAATDNARVNDGGSRTKFLARNITGEFISRMRSSTSRREAVLLDPPRQGPQAGVIAALGQRQPHRVLHVFCGVDQIPGALADWRTQGYEVAKVLPLDMFPGTAHLETLVLLRRGDTATTEA